jgi:integrase
MSEIKLTPALKSYTSSNGTRQVTIAASWNNEKTVFPVDVCVDPKNWNKESCRVTRKDKEHQQKNALIEKSVFDLRQRWFDGVRSESVICLSDLRKVKPKEIPDFYTEAQKYIERAGDGTRRGYTTSLNRMKEYAPKLKIKDITREWLEQFHLWLIDSEYSENTINATFIFMSAICRQPHIDHCKPFSLYKVKSPKTTKTCFLTKLEISQLWEYLQNLPTDNNDRATIAYFIQACYTGMRVVDWPRYKSDGMDIVYRAQKNSKDIVIPVDIMPQLRAAHDYISLHNLQAPVGDQPYAPLRRAQKALNISKTNEDGSDFVLTCHVAKKTAVTHLVASGKGIEVAAAIMGTSRKMLADTYDQADKKELIRSAFGLITV